MRKDQGIKPSGNLGAPRCGSGAHKGYTEEPVLLSHVQADNTQAPETLKPLSPLGSYDDGEES